MVSISSLPACPLRISRFTLDVSKVPVDFFADPDGAWEFDSLVEAAGFDPNNPSVCIGALATGFQGYPEGAAVVTEMGRSRSFVALVEYPSDDVKSAESPSLPRTSVAA